MKCAKDGCENEVVARMPPAGRPKKYCCTRCSRVPQRARFYRKHTERILKKCMEWRSRHPAMVMQSKARYYARHRDIYSLSSALWRADNVERSRELTRRYTKLYRAKRKLLAKLEMENV